jgi:large subunit ribosomal protein L17
MRHLKSGRALSIKPAHRHALMRNLVTSILEHGRVQTTLAKAKEVRRPLDRMITLAKRGDLHARRQALSFVKTKAAMANLFGDLATRFADRKGGYSRILPMGPRRGDAAQLALLMLVGGDKDPFIEVGKAQPKAGAGKGRKGSSKSTLEQVSEEVKAGAGERPAKAG